MNGKKTGVFSTRSPHRPNPIGLTLATLESVDHDVINVSGIDIIEGTPIIDIKPYIPTYDSPSERKASTEFNNSNNETTVKEEIKIADWIGKNTSIQVNFTPRALNDIGNIEAGKNFTTNLVKSISSILVEDPRSNYRKQKCEDRLYYLPVEDFKATVWFDEQTSPTTAEVLRVMHV